MNISPHIAPGRCEIYLGEVLQLTTRVLASNEMSASPLSSFWLVSGSGFSRDAGLATLTIAAEAAPTKTVQPSCSKECGYGYSLRTIVQAESSSSHPKIRILVQHAG